MDINELFNESANNIMSNNEFSDHAVAVVHQYNPVFNMQSPEITDSILKNQEQITKLIETQSRLIESLLKK